MTIAVCALLVPAFAASKDKTFSGEIMDSQCAKNASHEMMLKKEGMGDKSPDDPMAKKMCTLNCVKMGGKFVLFDAASKTVYQLDDQNLNQLEWQHGCWRPIPLSILWRWISI
jgi:hypothetical protein